MIELTSLLVLGIFAQWLAWKLKIPAILPLIITGLLVGPISTFFTESGQKFIDGDKIFHGALLFDFISIAVAIILFEGGLTLKLKEVRELAGTVRNMILFGSVISFLGGAVAAYYFLGLDYRVAMLFGSLIIVTGPTVIGPILRNVKPNARVGAILKWEGILIDPWGALIAIILYEFVVSGTSGTTYTLYAFKAFFATIAAGTFIGIVFAILVYYLLKRHYIPEYLRNIMVLALVVAGFTIAEFIHHESGLLTVTLMGVILANLKLPELKKVLTFKEDITLILVSLLFLLLSSRIEISDVQLLGAGSVMVFLTVVFVLRPLTVFFSARKSNLTFREKLFISWISPRGIVAAGVASIFTIRLTDPDYSYLHISDANLLLPLTFLIILGTVILQGLTAKPLAKFLGVTCEESKGVLFLGANEAARFFASYLKKNNVPVLLADTSKANIVEAKLQGLPTFEGSIMEEGVLESLDLTPYKQFFAMTSNNEVNKLSCKFMEKEFGVLNTYRLASVNELEQAELEPPKNLLFYGMIDFIGLVGLLRKTKELKSSTLTSQSNMLGELKTNEEAKILPSFIRSNKNDFVPVHSKFNKSIKEGDLLVYLER